KSYISGKILRDWEKKRSGEGSADRQIFPTLCQRVGKAGQGRAFLNRASRSSCPLHGRRVPTIRWTALTRARGYSISRLGLNCSNLRVFAGHGEISRLTYSWIGPP